VCPGGSSCFWLFRQFEYLSLHALSLCLHVLLSGLLVKLSFFLLDFKAFLVTNTARTVMTAIRYLMTVWFYSSDSTGAIERYTIVSKSLLWIAGVFTVYWVSVSMRDSSLELSDWRIMSLISFSRRRCSSLTSAWYMERSSASTGYESFVCWHPQSSLKQVTI